MKAILIRSGKGLIMCAYWAVVALFVWLFYDVYITEQTLISICMLIAFASAGLGLYGPIVYWLYKAELTPKLDLFKLEHTKIYDFLEKAYIKALTFSVRWEISFCNDEQYKNFEEELKILFPNDWKSFEPALKKENITFEYIKKSGQIDLIFLYYDFYTCIFNFV